MILKGVFSRGRRRAGKALAAKEELQRSVIPIWERLRQAELARGPIRVLVVGCDAGDGVTTVTLTVAESLAGHLRKEVLLIEANFRRPALARYLDMDPLPGLGDLLEKGAIQGRLVREARGHPGLRFVSGGSGRPPHQGEFASPAARNFFSTLEPAPFTLFDGGSLLESPDSRLLLEQVDGVILVARARSTETREVREAAQIVLDHGKPLIGVVLNRYRSDLPFGE